MRPSEALLDAAEAGDVEAEAEVAAEAVFVFHFVHRAFDQVDAQAANLPFLSRKRNVGVGLCQGVEGYPAIDEAKRCHTILDAASNFCPSTTFWIGVMGNVYIQFFHGHSKLRAHQECRAMGVYEVAGEVQDLVHTFKFGGNPQYLLVIHRALTRLSNCSV